jgi:hypothetical protein
MLGLVFLFREFFLQSDVIGFKAKLFVEHNGCFVGCCSFYPNGVYPFFFEPVVGMNHHSFSYRFPLKCILLPQHNNHVMRQRNSARGGLLVGPRGFEPRTNGDITRKTPFSGSEFSVHPYPEDFLISSLIA